MSAVAEPGKLHRGKKWLFVRENSAISRQRGRYASHSSRRCAFYRDPYRRVFDRDSYHCAYDQDPYRCAWHGYSYWRASHG